MKRRQFLKTTTAAAATPIFVNGIAVSALANSSLFSSINGESDRVLVLIQLNGGNDGLNTFIPLDYYDNLANLRSNVLIPENNLLTFEDTIGLHPNMTGIKNVYENAQMSVIQSVGYPQQNRSHFRSTDIWTSGSSSSEFVNTGWLGRYFDEQYANYPEEYPNEDCPDPFAITVGSQVSQTCQGLGGNFSIAINDPTNLNPLATGGSDDVPDTLYGMELEFLRQTIEQTNAYGDSVTAAADLGVNMVDYPADNALAQKLKNVALMISGGLQTKVYIVSIGGFDTHANQVEINDPTIGEHATLLSSLSQAIEVFQADLNAQDLDQRVIGMTFSEFGRRIRSNASFGTDHGDAAPMILFGSCVNPGIVGDNPVIGTEDQVGIETGVPMQFDFRDIYGSILMDWFEIEETMVQNLLYNDFNYMPILEPCLETNTGNLSFSKAGLNLKASPNPVLSETLISFDSANELVALTVANANGQVIETLINKTLQAGEHQITFDASHLAAGNYYVNLRMEDGRQKTILIHKLK